MSDNQIPDEQLADLDKRVAQLKEYLATHPSKASHAPPALLDGSREPFWNLLSLLSPVLIGLPTLMLASTRLTQGGDNGWGWGYLGAILITVAASSLFGFVAIVVSSLRHRRGFGIRLVAFCIHVLPIIYLFPKRS